MMSDTYWKADTICKKDGVKVVKEDSSRSCIVFKVTSGGSESTVYREFRKGGWFWKCDKGGRWGCVMKKAAKEPYCAHTLASSIYWDGLIR